ncbi:MAG: response regulator transcription factor [Anaerolineae bacterium]|nr:response regulator transcription factor [Thermoflexales bacterium]MDW8407400.1 response regulator transcription factor [Anaerolineae bacterium]
MKRTTIKKILLVQGGLGDSVGPALEQHGYRVAWVRSARTALEFIQKDLPALVVIDVPSLRVGPERLCLSIKRVGNVPIILIGPETPPGAVAQNGAAAPACADAYIPRPLQLRRFLSRVEKLMPEGQALELRCGDLVFRPANGILRKRSEELYLNPKLSKLLQLFMQRPGEVLTRKFLMQQVWETSFMGDTRTLDVHIRWLREAIEDDPSDPVYLRTVRRQGYRFENPKARK